MKKLFIVLAAMLTFASTVFAQIGSASSDLVYTPVTPCRLFDTRPSQGGTGPIAAAGTKHFRIWGQSSYAIQGGSPTNCGITASSNTAAVALNVTVVTPAAGGFVTAYPFGATLPNAATVNFQAGDIARGNFTIAKVDQSGAALTDLSVFSTSLADVVGDVVGYYSRPISAGSFECIDTVSLGTTPLAASSTATVSSSACTADFAMTGGSCIANSFGANVVTSRVNGSTYFCAYQNSLASATTVEARGRCCRVPGR